MALHVNALLRLAIQQVIERTLARQVLLGKFVRVIQYLVLEPIRAKIALNLGEF